LKSRPGYTSSAFLLPEIYLLEISPLDRNFSIGFFFFVPTSSSALLVFNPSQKETEFPALVCDSFLIEAIGKVNDFINLIFRKMGDNVRPPF
jgi:hypothetical protein